MFLLTIHVYYLKKEDNGGGEGERRNPQKSVTDFFKSAVLEFC
jgi:hypothetical protein